MTLCNNGTQSPWDVSTPGFLETSGFDLRLDKLLCCLKSFVPGNCRLPRFAGLIPISRPSDTLWSWKNDAVDSVSRFEDENEEKLGLGEGISEDNSFAGAAWAAASGLSVALSLRLMLPSPSGHPFLVSVTWIGLLFSLHSHIPGGSIKLVTKINLYRG